MEETKNEVKQNETLPQIFRKYGTDKDRNGYSSLYHILFSSFRNEKWNILEIGIGTMIPEVCSSMQGYALENYKSGGSLRAWRDFFPNAQDKT